MKAVPLTIYITAKDIREGIPGSATDCPVARAFVRAIERVMGVTPDHVTVIDSLVAHIPEPHSGPGDHYVNHWWIGSPALSKWIGDFDQREPVAPAKFALRPEPDTYYSVCSGCGDH